MDAQTPEHLRGERRTDDPGRRRTDETPAAHYADARQLPATEGLDPSGSRTSWGAYIRAHIGWVAAGLVVAIAAVIAGVLWWLNARQYESTDDAFIDARVATISAQVAGSISDLLVSDNQLVEPGTVLMRIDDRIFQAQLAQAEAQVSQAQANIGNLDAQIEAQKARIDQADKQVEQAQAALTFAEEEATRYGNLARTGSGTVQQAQQSRSNLLQAQATFAGAQANAVAERKQLAVLESQRGGAEAQLQAAQAQRNMAETNLSYTVLTAPVAGRVTKLTAAMGTYTAPGQALTMLVPTVVWVTANFKETQLRLMQPGQPAELRIDAFPDRKFSGHVDSIQAGSGTAFSLLPAENATGNYVKVVQRVPVKITFDQPPDVELGPGMSVVPSVAVQKSALIPRRESDMRTSEPKPH